MAKMACETCLKRDKEKNKKNTNKNTFAIADICFRDAIAKKMNKEGNKYKIISFVFPSEDIASVKPEAIESVLIK